MIEICGTEAGEGTSPSSPFEESENGFGHTVTLTIELLPEDYVPKKGRLDWLREHGVPSGVTIARYDFVDTEIIRCFLDRLTATAAVDLHEFAITHFLRPHAIGMARKSGGQDECVDGNMASALLYEYAWTTLNGRFDPLPQAAIAAFATGVGGLIGSDVLGRTHIGSEWPIVVLAMAIFAAMFWVAGKQLVQCVYSAHVVAKKWSIATGRLKYPFGRGRKPGLRDRGEEAF